MQHPSNNILIYVDNVYCTNIMYMDSMWVYFVQLHIVGDLKDMTVKGHEIIQKAMATLKS